MDEVTPIGSRPKRRRVSKRSQSTELDNQRALVAFEMRAGGILPSEIAKAMGLADVHQVHTLLDNTMAKEAAFLTDMERKGVLGLELIRLEKLLAAVWPSAMMGDPKSVHEAAEIVMKESRLTQLEMADPVSQKNLVLVMGEREDDYIAALKATQDD
jgi:hypothetical protein